MYHNSHVAYKTWNLELEISIDDAELYAIEKATKWFKTLRNFNAYMNFHKQSKRNSKRRKFDTFSCKRNLRNDWEITQCSISHSLNFGTRKYLWKWKSRSTPQISIFIKRNRSRQIFIFQTSKRTNHWTKSSEMIKSLKKQLEKRQALWEIRDKIKWLENSIFIEEIHETRHFNNYAIQARTRSFKSYLIRISNYDTKKCNENCNLTQDSEHLLLHCHHLTNDRSNLIKNMKSQDTTLKTLFETKKNLENLRIILINIEIVTRKWILSDVDDENEKKSV